MTIVDAVLIVLFIALGLGMAIASTGVLYGVYRLLKYGDR